MKGIILAAGFGARLSAYSGQQSKVLLPIAGRSLIEHTLESFRDVGITDIVVVTGYRADIVREYIGDGSDRELRIQYVFNPDYKLGNALSLYAARSAIEGETFLLSMADHLISSELLECVLKTPKSINVLAVDYKASGSDIAESTHVLVNKQGEIIHIGKNINNWNGVDAGVFQLTSGIFNDIENLLLEKRDQYLLSEAITRMIGDGHSLWACDISKCFWYDVDTFEDLEIARRIMSRRITSEYQRTALFHSGRSGR